ncbi:MAG: molybdopterin-dependent oxidoreductase [Pseudomonadota bacterium]
MDAGPATTVKTTCPYCGVGCGVIAQKSAAGVTISGDTEHSANYGRLCSKGTQLGETVGLEDRLLYPEIGGKRASWDDAIARVADAFSSAIAEHGPDSVAFYVSGQLLTEDYYVANKLMKGYIGSANIDTNSRLCMASSVAGHKRAFGSDTVPGTYEDFELADLIVLTGSNLAWCHPVLFQRIAAAKQKRPQMRVVTIDPRRTATTQISDLHLGLAPDTDVALFSGLLRHLARSAAVDPAYVDDHTCGSEDALQAASAWTIEAVAERCKLRPIDVAQFYQMVETTENTVTIYSQGVNQSSSGTDKVNAIINTHLLTGRIGRPGLGPFSVTGQPNAMGGREVGGLANMLACHMELLNADHRRIVQTFWDSPTIADKMGLKAVDLFEAVHSGQIKALWVMATNPSVSMPNADKVDEALARVPFLAVSDVVSNTDTLRHTRRDTCVALPATGWAEKDGTVTNSERVISRQRGFLPAPGEARHDWKIISDVAAAMGYGEAFNYPHQADVFDEYARLSGVENNGTRDFDISGLAGMSHQVYDALKPVRWPVKPTSEVGENDDRFFARGGFYHPDGRAKFITTVPAEPSTDIGPKSLMLNTGRVRDHWHTMTRTGRSVRLSAHMGEPYVELHPEDAADHKIDHADLVELTNKRGRAIVRALVTDKQRRGSVFVPMHWNDQTAGQARVDALVAPITDPFSGQPALKMSRVSVRKAKMKWFGFAVLREKPTTLPYAYWALMRIHGGYALEFADAQDAPARSTAEHLLSGASTTQDLIGDDLIGVEDIAQRSARYCMLDEGKLAGVVFVSKKPVSVSRKWASGLLVETFADRSAQMAVLAGRPPADQPDTGPTVCSCFSIGRLTIQDAITEGAKTVDAVGAACNAGTNCGSCRSEIASIIAQTDNSRTAKPEGDRREPQTA